MEVRRSWEPFEEQSNAAPKHSLTSPQCFARPFPGELGRTIAPSTRQGSPTRPQEAPKRAPPGERLAVVVARSIEPHSNVAAAMLGPRWGPQRPARGILARPPSEAIIFETIRDFSFLESAAAEKRPTMAWAHASQKPRADPKNPRRPLPEQVGG